MYSSPRSGSSRFSRPSRPSFPSRFRSGGGNSRRGSGSYGSRPWYVKKATEGQFDDTPKTSDVSFSSLGLSPLMTKTLLERGYEYAMPIQAQAVPIVLSGSDVIGLAQTGTGKTAAFLIPILEKIQKNPNEMALILAPTRELAQQIGEEVYKLTKYIRANHTICVGGASMFSQLNSLKRYPKLIIGTPGRIKDLIERRAINPLKFSTVVLDEVDRMVDMGFVRDITYLVNLLPKTRQSLFFSATTSGQVKGILNSFVQNSPVTVQVATSKPSENVDQDVVKFEKPKKIDKLLEVLAQKELEKTLIFLETKHAVDRLERDLLSYGHKVTAIHGGKPQNKRERAIRSFKFSETNILIATDVVARGIDIPDISHVINYDEPQTYEDYIHRIGRVGRAGRKGVALTFVASF